MRSLTAQYRGVSGGGTLRPWSCTLCLSLTRTGWVRATIEELPSVITCASTIDEARLLVRDALGEWLLALTTTERAAIPGDATRETLTLNVA